MALVAKHHDVDPEMVRRIEANPDAAVSPAEVAVLAYLTMGDDQRQYPLGRFTMGRFVANADEGDRSGDVLHTGSVFDDTFAEVAHGKVVDDETNPDGIYQVYVPI